jgi:hypothetical protein
MQGLMVLIVIYCATNCLRTFFRERTKDGQKYRFTDTVDI